MITKEQLTQFQSNAREIGKQAVPLVRAMGVMLNAGFQEADFDVRENVGGLIRSIGLSQFDAYGMAALFVAEAADAVRETYPDIFAGEDLNEIKKDCEAAREEALKTIANSAV